MISEIPSSESPLEDELDRTWFARSVERAQRLECLSRKRNDETGKETSRLSDFIASTSASAKASVSNTFAVPLAAAAAPLTATARTFTSAAGVFTSSCNGWSYSYAPAPSAAPTADKFHDVTADKFHDVEHGSRHASKQTEQEAANAATAAELEAVRSLSLRQLVAYEQESLERRRLEEERSVLQGELQDARAAMRKLQALHLCCLIFHQIHTSSSASFTRTPPSLTPSPPLHRACATITSPTFSRACAHASARVATLEAEQLTSSAEQLSTRAKLAIQKAGEIMSVDAPRGDSTTTRQWWSRMEAAASGVASASSELVSILRAARAEHEAQLASGDGRRTLETDLGVAEGEATAFIEKSKGRALVEMAQNLHTATTTLESASAALPEKEDQTTASPAMKTPLSHSSANALVTTADATPICSRASDVSAMDGSTAASRRTSGTSSAATNDVEHGDDSDEDIRLNPDIMKRRPRTPASESTIQARVARARRSLSQKDLLSSMQLVASSSRDNASFRVEHVTVAIQTDISSDAEQRAESRAADAEERLVKAIAEAEATRKSIEQGMLELREQCAKKDTELTMARDQLKRFKLARDPGQQAELSDSRMFGQRVENRLLAETVDVVKKQAELDMGAQLKVLVAEWRDMEAEQRRMGEALALQRKADEEVLTLQLAGLHSKCSALEIELSSFKENHSSIKERHSSIKEGHSSIKEGHSSIKEEHSSMKEDSVGTKEGGSNRTKEGGSKSIKEDGSNARTSTVGHQRSLRGSPEVYDWTRQAVMQVNWSGNKPMPYTKVERTIMSIQHGNTLGDGDVDAPPSTQRTPSPKSNLQALRRSSTMNQLEQGSTGDTPSSQNRKLEMRTISFAPRSAKKGSRRSLLPSKSSECLSK
ncbi:hypothetical protein AB1Y20_006087 [Prymnesium parvum]|uniref:Uncharacterized protein n=1 Tax=Prymnesium parvum TaxID=97485 RepID=A0AB34J3V2_PRYPA